MARLSTKQLINFSEELATMLEAGMPMSRSLEVLADQARGRAASVIGTLRDRIEAGSTLSEAMEQSAAFPEFFLRLVEVGETGGALDEVLAELGRFYTFRRSMRREFLARILFPVIEYVVGVGVVTFALYVLGRLGADLGSPFWVALLGYGVPVGGILAYQFVLKPLAGTRRFHEIALRLPVLGGISRALALARFSRVMHLTLEAGVPITEGVERAMEVTGNGAFAARAERVRRAIDVGATLTGALREAGVFPPQYTEIVEVAEESGMLSRRFDWLADHHAEQARYAMRAVVSVISKVIWVAVAVVMIVFIFRLFVYYRGALQGAMR
ncbi:MAG: type II secretion system F family protein [Candidatus Brocadiia bacterium]